MTDLRVKAYLTHMRSASGLAQSYIEGMSKASFIADTRSQQAVIMNLVIIGEIATKLDRDHGEFTDANPQIPWASMRGMRNRIAHGYFEINLDVVWDTVQTALPQLQQQLTACLTKLNA
jgi:uncharacterized protein with HEPN domain